MFDNYETNVEVDNQTIYLGLWDTAGQEGYDRLRPLSYPQTDVFLICFSLSSTTSFEHIAKKWLPELAHHAAGVPFLIVGTKGDLRSEGDNSKLPSFSHLESEAMKLGAYKYMECSAKKKEGLKELFEEAIRAALKHKSGPAEGSSGAKAQATSGGCCVIH